MNNDFEETAYTHGPVFSTFAYSLLEDILANAAHPARMNLQLVEQLRELTGARLVVLARQRELEGGRYVYELAAVEPERRRPLAESAEVMALAVMTGDLDGPTRWESGEAPPEAEALLEESLPGPSVAVPLRVGRKHVGALLLFGLPHKHSLDQVIDALGALSRVVALVLRNAALFEDQEATIAARTQELAESEERLEVTLRSIGDAVIATDVQGRVNFINPVAEELTGWEEAEAQGRPLGEVFPILNEETRQPVEDPVARVLREGVVVGLANHTLLVARDGTERPIADSGAPIRDAQGEITGVVLVFRDQTEERAAQKALRESEEKFRKVFERASIGKGLASPEGRFIDANRAFYEMLGYSKEEFLERTWQEVTHPNDLVQSGEYVKQLFEGDIPSFKFEHRLLHKDGHTVWVDLNVVLVRDWNGRPLHMVGDIVDITERVRAEEELVQRQLRLSVLNQVGRDLAGTLELARIYRIAYEHVAQLVDCPCFGISLYDPPTRTLRAEFMLDEGELIDAARFPPLVMGLEPTQGRVRAIVTRQPEIIANYPAALEKATDEGVRVGVSEDVYDTGAAMYVPMVARGQVMGLLEVQSYQLDAYSAEHAALLGPVANQIGLAIQNAHLYEEAQRELAERKQAEEALREYSESTPSRR